MTPSDPPRDLFIVRGPYKGGTVIRRSSGRYRIMIDGHHARFLGLRLAALPWLLVGWMTRSERDDEQA